MKMGLFKNFETNLKYHFSEVLNTPLAKPYWVFISVSHKCNFDCQMCGVKKILKEDDLDFTVLKRVLDEIAGWNSDCTVLLTGGEPFLRKDIFEIIGYSVSKGLKTEVVSNGSLIDVHMAQRIVGSGLSNVAISLDGTNPETHDNIRGVKGAHKKALEAFKNLSYEKRKKGLGPQISAWTTMMNWNLEELYDLIYLAKDAGVECLVYHPVIVTQDDMQNTMKDGDLWVKKERMDVFKKQVDKIIGYQKNNGLVAFLHDPYLWADYFNGTITKKVWKCNPFVFIDIGPDGEVRSCGPSFGNINEMTLADCLDTAQAQEARDRMKRCRKPCLQTCWARPEADSLSGIVSDFLKKLESEHATGSDKKAAIQQALGSLEQYETLLSKESKNGR
jgi:MoaA/NifB/PqqE/SkfB family radical SAM enzyme